ncbi:MAG TPA: hypothetical protein VM534_01880 [Thermoanaerobaculia bacterium]|nr:hypothetical protein [Thermoanaerobaculia bacterium]
MADTLLRFGLWIVIAVIAIFIFREASPDSQFGQLIEHDMLINIGKFGLLLIGTGILAMVFRKAGGKPRKGRCLTCGKKIGKGSLYCPQHVRRIVEEEDWKNRTLNTRRPDV